jgi:Inverse autotransporter, beta-domain
MKTSTAAFCAIVLPAFQLLAGPTPTADKGITLAQEAAIYQGSFNTGFKANDQYFDANVNIVAPVWSTMGTGGTLGGSVLFIEPYVSWGDNREVATSLGFGFRHLFNDQPVSALRKPKKGIAGFWEEGIAIGGNFFVDMLDTESRNQFWQLGVGAEVATRYVELRGNYYIPTTDRKLAERRVTTEQRSSSRTRESIQNDLGNPYDNGTGLLLQDSTTSVVSTTTTTTETFRHIFERYEKGLEGWDVELAVLVPYIDQWTDVKLIGGYMNLRNSPFGPQTGGTGAIKGWKAGVEIRPVPAIALTGMWYEDKKFLGADWVVGARMEIPFELGEIGDGKTFWSRIGDAFRPRRRHLAERMAEPVHRQNAAIKTGSSQKETTQSVSTQTTSRVQVLSQTKNQIILGLGPSGTDFQYIGSGSVTITGNGGGGASTQTLSGRLYVSRSGSATLELDNNTAAILIGNISQITSSSLSIDPRLTGHSVIVKNNPVPLQTYTGGSLILAQQSSSSGNTYSGGVVVNTQPVLNLSGNPGAAYVSNPVLVTSGAGVLAVNPSSQVSVFTGSTFSASTLTIGSSAGLTISNGALVKTGMTLVDGANLVFDQSTQVNGAGGLTLSGVGVNLNSLTSGSAVIVRGGSLSTGTGASSGSAVSFTGIIATVGATTTIGGSTSSNSNTGTLTLSGGSSSTGTGSSIGSTITLGTNSGSAAGTLNLSGASTITGTATLNVQSASVIQSGTINVGGNVLSLIPATSN